jgi:hypothetical protein
LIIVFYIFFWNLKQVSSNLSASHTHKESEKSINNNQKSVQLVKNKIKPANVMKIYGHDKAVGKVTIIYDWARRCNLRVYSSDLTIAYSLYMFHFNPSHPTIRSQMVYPMKVHQDKIILSQQIRV